MTRLFTVLTLALVLLLAFGGSTWAGVLPFEDYDKPGDGVDNGDGGEDDDHPWGGDRVIGHPPDGSELKYVDVTYVTGYAAIDLTLITIINFLSYDPPTTVVTTSSIRADEEISTAPSIRKSTSRRAYTKTWNGKVDK